MKSTQDSDRQIETVGWKASLSRAQQKQRHGARTGAGRRRSLRADPVSVCFLARTAALEMWAERETRIIYG